MAKEFDIQDLLGKDPVKLLEEDLVREGLTNVRIRALCNDAVGTLMCVAYEDPECDMGVILGTDTNACYPESLSNIPKAKGLYTASGKMIVNIEWGNFDKLVQSPYDTQLDNKKLFGIPKSSERSF